MIILFLYLIHVGLKGFKRYIKEIIKEAKE